MKPSKEDFAAWQHWIRINRQSAACDLIDLSDATEYLIALVEEQQRKLNGQDIACNLLKDEVESLKSLLRRATLIARQVHKDAYYLVNYTNDWFKDLSQIDSTFQDKL